MATWRTLDVAAEQISVSRRTIERWIAQGRIKSYNIAGDRHTYVDLDEIRKLREPKERER
jgi:excisionase family DNA binding protein